MKATLILVLSLFSQAAFSFETGKYYGTNEDGTQWCEIELVQKTSSIVLKSMFCSGGISWGEETELSFGHGEGIVGSARYIYFASEDQVRRIAISNDNVSNGHEIITKLSEDKISYHLYSKGQIGDATHADLELTKQ